MLFLIEGNDFIWKKATIDWAATKWPTREMIWADEVEEKWLVAYLDVRDYIIVRNSEELGDLTAELLKSWRNRNLVFEGTELKSSTFKRRLQKLGTWVQCEAGSSGTAGKVEFLAERMGMVDLGKQYRHQFNSVSDAYWFFTLTKLGANPAPPQRLRETLAWKLLFYDPGMLNFTVSELITTIRGLSRMTMLNREGANKWRLVQEALRIDPGQVGGLYGVSLRLADNAEELNRVLARALRLSRLLEEAEGADIPMELLYLKIR